MMLKRVILGGYVQQERNLSQFGNAWVCGNVQVYGNAWVYGDAQVCGDARIYGNAKVYGDVIASEEHVYDTN